MKIHLYALCWNEEKMLPYFFYHYDQLVDQFYVYDHQSTDRSRELLKNHPKVELQDFSVSGDSFVFAALEFYNHIWKYSRGKADWVILCNIDEHFYHPQWHVYLKHCMEKNISIIPSIGYEMISDYFPTKKVMLSEQIRYGYPSNECNKIACFNPNMIDEINFGVGRHHANPTGDVSYPKTVEMKLLHYKAMGLDYLVSRSAELSIGLRKKDRDSLALEGLHRHL